MIFQCLVVALARQKTELGDFVLGFANRTFIYVTMKWLIKTRRVYFTPLLRLLRFTEFFKNLTLLCCCEVLENDKLWIICV